jgi:hypothetical protein
MMSKGPPTPVPNQRAANATHAIGEMKRTDSNKGVNTASNLRDHPAHNPSGTPMKTASEKPPKNLSKLVPGITGPRNVL